MGEKEIGCKDKYHDFQKKHPNFFRQPIVRSFLQDDNHYELVQWAVCSPSEKNRQKVDEAFKKFFGSVKTLTYLSNLIYYNAVNFDKNMKKHNTREMLTLDQPLQDAGVNEGVTHKDMLYYPTQDITDEIVHEAITDYVGDPKLYQALQTLTPKQQDILTRRYVLGLQNKGIAALFGDSPQNISKLHQRALQKIKKYLKQEEKHRDNS